MTLPAKIEEIIRKGVSITDPLSVEIGDEVSLERIAAKGVVLYGGTKILGAGTLISEGVKIGFEGPATVVDCRLGPEVMLNGGFFQSSVFLDKASVAYGGHVREGSLLEEEVKAGHAVGLKQTLLFPFVTLGSLINFCDCLMAGGTSREDHSEVGSSYVHFNYTPQQDKATPSLIGDVPRGVMLDQPPIFLGGQGGLVGPVRIDYGTVISAGSIWRNDSFGAKLLHGGSGKAWSRDFRAGAYGDIGKKVYNNILYIANLIALRQWYMRVRRPFFLKRELGEELFAGAIDCIERMIAERISRFREFAEKMEKSLALSKDGQGIDVLRRQRELKERWCDLEACFDTLPYENTGEKERAVFIEALHRQAGVEKNYIEAVRSLNGDAKRRGTLWLQRIADEVVQRALANLPSFETHAA